ncbi:MAG: hypothetical protein ACNYZG_04750 [Gammaproteobacteria bacterium]
MIRLILGFILGVVATYYTAPSLKSPFKDINVSSIKQMFQSDEQTHSSNTFNSMSPSDISALNNNKMSAKVRTAISLISARNLNDQTSDYAVNLITDLVEQEPGLQQFVLAQLNDGITNKEALNIFEQYFSLQG